jgi:hypothetical protein
VTAAEHAPPRPFTAAALRPRVLAGLAAVVAAFRRGACAGGVACAAPGADGNGDGGAAGASSARAAAAAVAAGRQLKLTMLMTWRDGASGEFDLWCHGEALPDRPRPPIKLQIRCGSSV